MKSNFKFIMVSLIIFGTQFAMERQAPIGLEEAKIADQATPKIREIGNKILNGKMSEQAGYSQLTPMEQKILTYYLRGWRKIRSGMQYRRQES